MTICDNCRERTINPELTVALMFDRKVIPLTKPHVLTLCQGCLSKFNEAIERTIQCYKAIPPKV